MQERNAFLIWLWKPALIIAGIVGVNYLTGDETIGGALGLFIFIFGTWFLSRFMDALNKRPSKKKQIKADFVALAAAGIGRATLRLGK